MMVNSGAHSQMAEPCKSSIYLVADMSLAIIPNFIKPTMNHECNYMQKDVSCREKGS